MSSARTTVKHPRQLVQNADMTDLLLAYVAGLRHPFALVPIDGEMHFVCPRCSRCTINGGTGKVIDQVRWSCHACHYVGTRFMLERIVLECADSLEALYELSTT